MSIYLTLEETRGMHPDSSGSTGYFSWHKKDGQSGVDAFEEVYIVCAYGLFQTEQDGRIDAIAPVKYCNTKEEAINLVAQLNTILGTDDYNNVKPKL